MRCDTNILKMHMCAKIKKINNNNMYMLEELSRVKNLHSDFSNYTNSNRHTCFFLTDSVEVLNTLIQKLRERDVEVFLLDDPIDEFCIQNLSEYEKKTL